MGLRFNFSNNIKNANLYQRYGDMFYVVYATAMDRYKNINPILIGKTYAKWSCGNRHRSQKELLYVFDDEAHKMVRVYMSKNNAQIYEYKKFMKDFLQVDI